MAKVFGKIVEEEVTFLTQPEIEFVSLVKYAANRMPFKIIKEEGNMSNMLYRVLVPKDMDETKLKELAEKYSFSIDNEEDGGKEYRVFKQKDVEKMEDKETALVALDKENKIYAVVVGDKKDDITTKYDSTLNLDDIITAMYAMEEIIFGTLSQPAVSNQDRIDMIKKAIQNFVEFTTSILENTKAEDVITKTKKDEPDMITKAINTVFEKVEKDIRTKQEEIDKSISEFEGKVASLIDEKIKALEKAFKDESATFVTKETFDSFIKEVKEKIEEVSNVITRKSEPQEPKHVTPENKVVKTSDGYRFFTAI